MQEPLPYNHELEKIYRAKVEQSHSAQKIEYEKRKESNQERAKVQTQKRIHEYKLQKLSLEEKARQAELNNQFFVPADPKFFLVIRIRGMNRVPPKERKTLDLMRLRKPNTGVLLVNNESVRSQLQLVRNYIAYGFISLELLRELIYKRGMTKKVVTDNLNNKSKQVVNISNEIIEEKFNGELFCLEDIIYHLYNGKRFAEMNRFLNPFKLNCPRGGFKGKKAKDVLDGGSCGNWHFKIEDLVKRMIN